MTHNPIRALPEKITSRAETDLLQRPLGELGSGIGEPMIEDGAFDTRKFSCETQLVGDSGDFIFGRSKTYS